MQKKKYVFYTSWQWIIKYRILKLKSTEFWFEEEREWLTGTISANTF